MSLKGNALKLRFQAPALRRAPSSFAKASADRLALFLRWRVFADELPLQLRRDFGELSRAASSNKPGCDLYVKP
jgi:hypothetical protein